MIVVFEAQLWEWDARRTDSWVFVSLPADASEDIRELAAEPRRGFGSVRVRVTIGATSWKTSIFPDVRARPTSCRSSGPSGWPKTSTWGTPAP